MSLCACAIDKDSFLFLHFTLAGIVVNPIKWCEILRSSPLTVMYLLLVVVSLLLYHFSCPCNEKGEFQWILTTQNYQCTFIKSQSAAAVDEQRRVLRQCAMTNPTKGALCCQSLPEKKQKTTTWKSDTLYTYFLTMIRRERTAKYHVVHLSALLSWHSPLYVLFVAHNGPVLENVKWFFDGLL